LRTWEPEGAADIDSNGKSKGTDINAKDYGDHTPLGYAYGQRHKEAVEWLKANGAE